MEDYKEKYEQALERAKVINPGTVDYEVAVKIFPELKESEDEKIRKECISIIDAWDKSCRLQGDYCEVAPKCIAWLEKQGEQKPEELPNGEDYGIDSLYHATKILEKTLGEVEGYQSDDGILEHKCAIEAVKRLYKQKSAWSEEDENYCLDVNAAVSDYFDEGYAEELKDWLKSLKEKVQPQPKREWSEKDEEMIEGLNNCLDELEEKNGWNYTYVNDKDVKLCEVRNWLKSLKERIKV